MNQSVSSRTLLSDVAVGVISGYVGTRVMEPVSMKLYEWESEADRQQEDRVRRGPPYQIPAQKAAQLFGLPLADQQLGKAGILFHYGLGLSWGPLCTLLRRFTHMHPVGAGLVTGTAMSLLVDEGLTPTLGLSAPNRAYPLVTHVREFLAHLAYGLGVAATAEGLYFIGRNGPGRR